MTRERRGPEGWKIVATPQDGKAQDDCVEIAKSAEHVLCVGCDITYNTWTWSDLTPHEYDVIWVGLSHFGVDKIGHLSPAFEEAVR